MRSSSLLSLSLSFLLPLGCAPEQHVEFFQSVNADPSFPGTPGDRADYEAYFSYTPNPDCVPRVPRKLDRRTEIRLFLGDGVAANELGRYAGGLQRYYDFFGVDMYSRHEPVGVPIDHAIVLNDEAIANWMRDVAGVDPACASSYSPTLACERALGAAMFYNVKQFLHAYAEPDRSVINVVLLKRVASLEPSDANALLNWGIAGLGLSEELLASEASTDLGTSLADILDETDFSPTVFLAVNLIDFLLEEPDIVAAHELGHAYGLEHLEPASYGENLMNPGADACDLSLNESQLDTIEAQTTRYGNLLFPGRHRGPELLSFVDRAPEIISIVRARVAARAAAAGAAR